jgi:hypothetical protein
MAREFNIAKSSGCCTSCEKQLEPGDTYTATLRETDDEFFREDYCPACWEQTREQISEDVFGVWQGQIPQPRQKKKLLVDDEVLLNFFQRLEGAQQTERIQFRYVLTLILMRKRLISYEGSRRDNGTEIWLIRRRGSGETYEVTDPKLSEDEISTVSEQLNQVLEQDL